MAAATSSPCGFSYAQAAKGKSSTGNAQSNKATSGTTTPGSSSISELTPGANWADDVEADAKDKPAESQKAGSESNKPAVAKDSAVERAKQEEKAQTPTSGVSSPDLAASASTTTKDDESSTAPTNGSSETTWETKSHASEPSWIADRKERQSTKNENNSKGGKKSKKEEQPPPKPVILHEAAVPTVNPWLQRKEALGPKPVAQQPSSKPAQKAPQESAPLKENQRPQVDSRKKATAATGTSQSDNDVTKPDGASSKRANEAPRPAPQGPTTGTSDSRPSIPSSTASALGVKDETSWPTPVTAQEKERKDATEKESSEKTEDAAPAKPKKKKEWQSMLVTPSVIFETPNIRGRDAPRSATTERGGRGGARGRGGMRGAANGVNAGDRSAGKPPYLNGNESNTASPQWARSDADRDTKALPAKSREATENPQTEQRPDGRAARSSAGQSVPETTAKDSKMDPDQRKNPNDRVGANAQAQRIASPAKADSVPSPSGSGPTGGKAAEAAKPNGNVPQDSQSARPSDGRKDAKPYENGFREPAFNGQPRGGKRNGRGRGGSREFVNGHHANHTFANGDFATPGFGGPSSSFAGPRGNHQFGYGGHGRGGFSRGNPRSQSIPMDNFYGRFSNGYMPPTQPYMPGMYEYGYPVSALPYQPMFDQQYLMDMVSTQLEYYFSLDNLLKDMFLRRHMDSQGFVLLDVVAGFNRLKQLTQDKEILKTVCLNSETIEIRVGDDGKERLRRRDGWEQFVMPMEQREPAAQTEGPKVLHRPEKPQLQNFAPPSVRGPQSAFPGGQPRFDRAGYPVYPGMPPYGAFASVPEAAYAEMLGGDDARGRPAKSPQRDHDIASFVPARPSDEKDLEPDAFPEDQVSALTVVVRVNKPQPPFHNAATRTFSNGSIDSRSIFGEIDRAEKSPEKANEGQSAAQTNGETQTNGATPSNSASRHGSPSTPRSQERNGMSPDMSVFWMKDETLPSEAPTGVSLEPYVQLRLKALSQRSQAATGTCPYDLEVLYQFWCHFLIRNFNSRMYNEFRYYATEDGKERHNVTGMQNLVKFYSQALLSHNPIRDRLVRDYVELVKTEPSKLEGTAFKNLRAAWRNGALNLKNRKKLSDLVDEALKGRLEG
ncbi:hypothetical protein KC354_g3917 [Hortaea werneckii]|nr:hypothetical protein KC354_g3917 [Hortaea werneckii]